MAVVMCDNLPNSSQSSLGSLRKIATSLSASGCASPRASEPNRTTRSIRLPNTSSSAFRKRTRTGSSAGFANIRPPEDHPRLEQQAVVSLPQSITGQSSAPDTRIGADHTVVIHVAEQATRISPLRGFRLDSAQLCGHPPPGAIAQDGVADRCIPKPDGSPPRCPGAADDQVDVLPGVPDGGARGLA